MSELSWRVQCGDMMELCTWLTNKQLDCCVTDPPYELGFMGRDWDSSGVSFEPMTWRHVYCVLKPGAHLIAFGGTRTSHRIACAIQDAGFEIRDQISWMYASGFPKSLNISKAIDKKLGTTDQRETVGSYIAGGNAGTPTKLKGGTYATGAPNSAPVELYHTTGGSPEAKRWDGWGTALKPANEPIIVARKPFKGLVADNVLKHGTGGINVDGGRIQYVNQEDQAAAAAAAAAQRLGQPSHGAGVGDFGLHTPRAAGSLDPYLANQGKGRWPANVILDEHCAALLDEQVGDRSGMSGGGKHRDDYAGGMFGAIDSEHLARGDNGGPSRFFFVPKASRQERELGLDGFGAVTPGEATGRKDGSDGLRSPRAGAGRTAPGIRNNHPTVKPIELMRYLVRLFCPPGGTVLDPFCGSGTTGMATLLEGMRFIGFDLDPNHCDIASARIAYVAGGKWDPLTERATAVEPKQRSLFE